MGKILSLAQSTTDTSTVLNRIKFVRKNGQIYVNNNTMINTYARTLKDLTFDVYLPDRQVTGFMEYIF